MCDLLYESGPDGIKNIAHHFIHIWNSSQYMDMRNRVHSLCQEKH